MNINRKIVTTGILFLVLINSLKGQYDSLSSTQKDSILIAYKEGMFYRLFQMNKEETYMIKAAGEITVNFTARNMQTEMLFIGLENKLKPSVSIENLLFINPGGSYSSIGASSYIKYYYDLRKRIFEGRSANNFSADYFKFGIEQSANHYEYYDLNNPDYKITKWKYDPKLVIGYGIQRRFSSLGFIELSVYSSYSLTLNEFMLSVVSIKCGFGLPKIRKHEK
jgi:hypothetical protein